MKQREMPLYGDVKRRPRLERKEILSLMEDADAAVTYQINMTGLPYEHLADPMGYSEKSKGHLCRVARGGSSLPVRKLKNLIEVSGSMAVIQLIAEEFGYELTPKTAEKRIAELEQELQRLKGVA